MQKAGRVRLITKNRANVADLILMLRKSLALVHRLCHPISVNFYPHGFSVQEGRTPLHIACSSSSLEVLSELLEWDSDIEARDKVGMYIPLHLKKMHILSRMIWSRREREKGIGGM